MDGWIVVHKITGGCLIILDGKIWMD